MSGRPTDQLGGRSIRRFAAEEWSSELKSLLLNPIYRLARIAAMPARRQFRRMRTHAGVALSLVVNN
jgi:hypothetical protein